MEFSKIRQNKDIGKFDVMQVIRVLCKKWYIIALSALTCGVLMFVYTINFITPTYQASVVFYVNNSNISLNNNILNISPSDLTAAKSLVDTYIVILKTSETLDEIATETKLDYSTSQLFGMISAGDVNSTEIFRVNVAGSSTEDILKIAKAISKVLPDRIARIVEGSDVRIVNHAIVDGRKIAPSVTNNTLMGLAIGALICALIIVMIELNNNTVRSEEYLNEIYNIPVLTVVPNMFVDENGIKYQKRSDRK